MSANPDEAQISLSYVAFLDILGFSTFTLEAQNTEESIEKVKMLRIALEQSNQYIDSFNYSKYMPGFAYQFFSDCLVLGFPVGNDFSLRRGESEFARFISLVSAHQISMALNGFFIRGALSFGELCMDSHLVYGKALIEAYKAETKDSIVPRVILTPTVKEIVYSQLQFYVSKWAPHNRSLIVDTDGLIFLNYLDELYPATGHLLEDELALHKTILEERLQKFEPDDKIYRKYVWLCQYHNFFVSNFATSAIYERLTEYCYEEAVDI